MGFRFQMKFRHAKHIVCQPSPSPSLPSVSEKLVPKGHLTVYVGENKHKNRFVVPILYLNDPLFQDLLRSSEEEYALDHPMGGLTIPCSENAFKNVTSYLNGLQY